MRISLVATITSLAALSATTGYAQGGYLRTGTPSAEVCRGFIVKYCEFVSVDALRDASGAIHPFPVTFASVHSYDGKTCMVRLRDQALRQNSAGALSEVNADIVTFACTRL